MEALELSDLIQRGENSSLQLKERVNDAHSISQELVAFSNSRGGIVVIGVNDKTGFLNSLSFEEIQTLNNLLVNASTNNVHPSIIIYTEVVTVNNSNLIIVHVEEGLSKPYKDKNGAIWIKNGSDKRRVTSNDEIARLLQSSKIMFSDELPIRGTSVSDIDIEIYKRFIQRKYNRPFDDLAIGLDQSLENLNLLKDGNLTLAGLLLFSKNRHKHRPLFSVQCVAVNGIDLKGNSFDDNEPAFEGNLRDVFDNTISFIGRNLKKIQVESSFNSQGVWEIPYEVFEELVVNALIHRDYFISSTIKVFIFSDRIEIISPGKLPNSLTVDNIRNGISIPRNPILQSLGQHVLPYKGLGTGIVRAEALYPDISFINEPEKERFQVIIRRPSFI